MNTGDIINMKSKPIPPLYFFVLLLLLITQRLLWPIALVIPSPYTWLGLPFVIFGVGINIWADQLYKNVKTAIKPHDMPTTLVTSGPFRFSRNPMYLGMTAILLGAALLSGSAVAFAFPLIFLVLIAYTCIPLEERNMETAFGQRYLDYKNAVRRWL
jgi:protein-S-isoprenylcysteine O-methyltransferase Ste14